jgi:hypothetical protein
MESLFALNIVSIKDSRRRYRMDTDSKLYTNLRTFFTGTCFLVSRLLSFVFSYFTNIYQAKVSDYYLLVKNVFLTKNSFLIPFFELDKGRYGRAGPSVLNIKGWFYQHHPVPG